MGPLPPPEFLIRGDVNTFSIGTTSYADLNTRSTGTDTYTELVPIYMLIQLVLMPIVP